MSRITSILALALTLGLLSASVVLGRQGTSGGSVAGSATSVTASKAPATLMEKLKGKSAHKHAKVDLNSATREELAALPGVNEATADKIIAARPMKSVHELLSKGIVTEPEYKKLFSRTMTKPIK
jgi:competence protein ComEA